MGYVVCHIQKPKGNDAGTSAHIERKVRDAKLQLTNDPGTPNASGNPHRLRLSLNGKNILDWFREQFEKLRQVVRPYVRQTVAQPRQGKGRSI